MEDERTPRVSIALPVYNGENFLEEAIGSILAQTYGDYELVISDNCSSDATPQIAQHYASQDGRVRYVRQPRNLGGAGNFNWTARAARSEFFKWAAHDDLLEPSYLEACVAALDEQADAVLAFPNAEVIGVEGEVIEVYEDDLKTDCVNARHRFRDLLGSWHRCYEIFGLFRTSALRRTRLLGPYWGADRTLLMELALQGPFTKIGRTLFYPRRHPEQSIMKKDVERAVYLDPRSCGRIILPNWQAIGWNLRLARQAEGSLTHKAILAAYVGGWSLRHWRRLTRDLKRATRQILSGYA